jgi:hypothetical protein
LTDQFSLVSDSISSDIKAFTTQAPSLTAFREVDSWLASNDKDPNFWLNITAQHSSDLTKWVSRNPRVRAGQVLSALLCAGSALLFGSFPLQGLNGRDPLLPIIATILFVLISLALIGSLVFRPLTGAILTTFGARISYRIQKRFSEANIDAIEGIYKETRHHPATCQFLYSVNSRRPIVMQDLIVAKMLSSEALQPQSQNNSVQSKESHEELQNPGQ